MKKRILLFITIFIAATIFLHSAMPADQSQAESSSVFELFDSFLTALHIPNLFNENTIRKLAHFTEYSVFGFFLCATVNAYGGFKNQIFKILFILLALPVADEFSQNFSDGRSAQVGDVLIDFCGGIFGGCVIVLIILTASFAAKHRSSKEKY